MHMYTHSCLHYKRVHRIHDVSYGLVLLHKFMLAEMIREKMYLFYYTSSMLLVLNDSIDSINA